MKLKKGGWLCRMTGHSGEQISLCKFFWRVIYSGLVIWPIIGFFWVIVSFGGFLFGKKFSDNSTHGVFAPIKSMPSIFGYRILPIYPIICLEIYFNWPESIPYVLISVFVFSAFGLLVGGAWLISHAESIVKYFRMSTPESYQLLKAYLKAKKDKVCPMIEFE